MSLIACVAVPGWQGGHGQCLRGAAPGLLDHVGGGHGARCGVRGPSWCQAGHQSLSCPGLPPRQHHVELGVDWGPARRLGSVPCGVMLTGLSPLRPVPRGWSCPLGVWGCPETASQGRGVNGCSLQDLCAVSDLTFMVFFFFWKSIFLSSSKNI